MVKKTVPIVFNYWLPYAEAAENLVLLGSWNEDGEHDEQWSALPVPMSLIERCQYQAVVSLEVGKSYRWGVRGDCPGGPGQWLIADDEPPVFKAAEINQEVHYRLGQLDEMGVRQDGDGFRVKAWFPGAQNVHVRFGSLYEEPSARYSLAVDDSGYWFGFIPGEWSHHEDELYAFECQFQDGTTGIRPDPYSWEVQGPQYGLHDLWLDKEGRVVPQFSEASKEGLKFLAFSPPLSERKDKIGFRLLKEGKVLTKSSLLALVGAKGKARARKAHPEVGCCYYTDAPINRGFFQCKNSDDFLGGVVIPWSSELIGLKLEWLLADGGVWSDRERCLIDGHHNWYGLSRLKPTPSLCLYRLSEKARSKSCIYEVHPRSWMKDLSLSQRFSAWHDRGWSEWCDLAMMPLHNTENYWDWGYRSHERISLDPGLEWSDFSQQAVNKEVRLWCDLVWNHVGGVYSAFWRWDGARNSWCDPQGDTIKGREGVPFWPGGAQESDSDAVRTTPWGSIPNFAEEAVSNFYFDQLLAAVQVWGFRGIRFDFTHPIHAPSAGGEAGFRLLRKCHRFLQCFWPEVKTQAEEYPQSPVVTESVNAGGMGFSGMWWTEWFHRLVSHHGGGWAESGHGFQNWLLEYSEAIARFGQEDSMVVVASSHDEVGNGWSWGRLLASVTGDERLRVRQRLNTLWALAALSPGTTLIFSGHEALDVKKFWWGQPQTWSTCIDPTLEVEVWENHMKSMLQTRSNDGCLMLQKAFWVQKGEIIGFPFRDSDKVFLMNCSEQPASLSLEKGESQVLEAWDFFITDHSIL